MMTAKWTYNGMVDKFKGLLSPDEEEAARRAEEHMRAHSGQRAEVRHIEGEEEDALYVVRFPDGSWLAAYSEEVSEFEGDFDDPWKVGV